MLYMSEACFMEELKTYLELSETEPSESIFKSIKELIERYELEQEYERLAIESRDRVITGEIT